ncbi:TonB-dependent receptor plug domain-containing protein [Portibacter marinus]|uniref:TonB-dependent receptor plug domain-containing protein n=1 Tax=Portibacter marinus TaxID=2898660 RepID=UPI001F378BF8|nr:TonB-dependent receptor [Portibacter marinus]
MKNFILILLIVPSLLSSQSVDTTLVLDDIMLYSDRISMPFLEDSRSIEVIRAEEIAKIPARDVAGILQFATGVDIRQRGPHGVQADIGIRGGGFEQTLILINGLKMTDPQTGHHVMNLPISPENIERIEIIKGPAARIYGQNAFAGVVNIITKVPDELKGTIHFKGGQNQLLGMGLEMSLPSKLTDQYLSINRNVSEGYRYNTDYDITNFIYQNQFVVSGAETSLFAGFTEREFGANGFYASPNFRDQYEEVQTSIVGLQSKILRGAWIIKPKVYWRRNQDEYIFVRSNPSLYRNMHIGNNLGAEVNTSYINDLGTTGLGIEFRNENLVSTNLGTRKRQLVSAYVEQRLDYGKFSLTPGISFQYFTDFGPHFFYGADASYNFSRNFMLYGSVGTTYRVPSYTDRFYTDPANEGNADLKPETALTSEIGVKRLGRNFNLQLAAFRRIGNDLIDWTRDTLVSPKWTPVNLNRVPVNGFEASLSVNLGYISGLSILGYQKINYTYIDAVIESSDAAESRYLLENLRHQLTYLGSFNAQYFYANITYRYLDRVNLNDYQLLDVRLSKQFKRFKAFVDINNVFDEEYKETNLVPMPGRWIVIGTSFKMY